MAADGRSAKALPRWRAGRQNAPAATARAARGIAKRKEQAMALEDLDKFIRATLRAYLDEQRRLYIREDTEPDHVLRRNQATYEVATAVLTTLTRWLAEIPAEDTEELPPEPLLGAMGVFHTALCEHGDNMLRIRGYKPEDI